MKDFENKLRDMSLAGPSADLDHRMGETLRAAAHKPRSARETRHSWRILALAASGVAAALLLAVLAARHGKPSPIAYRIEAKGSLRQLLLAPPSTGQNQPHFTVNGNAP